MINILIADDHTIIRKGLREILSVDPEIRIAGETDNFTDVVSEVINGNYDLLIMDIDMPQGNALDTIKQLKQFRPDLPILILSIYPENQYAVRMIKAGASGYLTKKSLPEELLIAINKISSGGVYVNPTVAGQLINNLGGGGKIPHETLSDREYQVFKGLASGKTVQMLSDDLHLSKQTISTYRTRILQKMNLKNNADLVSYGVRYKLID